MCAAYSIPVPTIRNHADSPTARRVVAKIDLPMAEHDDVHVVPQVLVPPPFTSWPRAPGIMHHAAGRRFCALAMRSCGA